MLHCRCNVINETKSYNNKKWNKHPYKDGVFMITYVRYVFSYPFDECNGGKRLYVLKLFVCSKSLKINFGKWNYTLKKKCPAKCSSSFFFFTFGRRNFSCTGILYYMGLRRVQISIFWRFVSDWNYQNPADRYYNTHHYWWVS